MDSEAKKFLALTFEGGRFSAHSVPVHVLMELATVQQLILGVARQLYLQRHPDRERLPRGFVDAAQLHLASAEANCFTAQLERPGTWPGASAEELTLFEESRDLSIQALAAAGRGDAIPSGFPKSSLKDLAALGRRLADDEHLLLRGVSTTSPSARVDQTSRANLARLIKGPFERVQSFDGEVEAVDTASRRFTLRTRSDERVEVQFEITHREALVTALDQRPAVRVRVRGLTQQVNSLHKMTNLEELDLVDDERAPEIQKVWERLASFKTIQDGWFDGDGRAPSPLALSLARGVLARLLVERRELPRPSIFPTPQGGMQAEWVLGPWAADVLFDADDGSLTAEATHVDCGEERTARFSRVEVSEDSVAVLARWLAALM